MKRILSLLTILVFVCSCLLVTSAQTKRRKRTSTGASARRNNTAPGRTVTLRNGQRGRYVTRNGRRIWVPQGSPAIGNRRGVYEKESEAELKKKSTNTNRP